MNKEMLNAIIAGCLVLAIGLLSGYSLGYYQGARNRFPEIVQVGEVNPGIATMRIEGVREGRLVGSVAGREVRLVLGEKDIRELPIGSSFEIPIVAAGVAEKPISVPPDAQFVASRKGKYYYSLFDSRGMEIVTENRLYFKSAGDAEAQGYQKPTTPP